DTYAKFVAEPFEAGYGHTVGNSLRRVLLSSLEGAAITAVKINGAQHEFATLPGVVEDVTDIVLNLKKVKFKAEDHEPKKLSLTLNREGEVTAGDIQVVQGYDVLNPKQVICTLDKKHKFDAELEVRVGRGFATGEENKRADQIVLNLKKVKFKAEDHEPKKLSLTLNREGEVTAGDIQVVQGYDVLNPKQVICTLDKKHKFDAELEVRVGRGFATGEENKRAD